MDIRKISAALSGSPQIGPTDSRALAAADCRAVICNCPAGAGPDQPGYRELERAAASRGLQVRCLPAAPEGREWLVQPERVG